MEQLEGRISIEAALAAHSRRFKLVIIRAGLHQDQISNILQHAEAQNVPVKWVPGDELDAMAHGKTHGGIIALAWAKKPISERELYETLQRSDSRPLILILEGVDDHQNLGFILRTAEAAGVQAVALKKHLWDLDGAAVSRASSGAYERIPMFHFEDPSIFIPPLKGFGLSVIGCIANVRRSIFEASLSSPVALALGGEKRGLSAALRDHCDQFIKIPMLAPLGSLSLSHAAAIVLGEAIRQRTSENVEK